MNSYFNIFLDYFGDYCRAPLCTDKFIFIMIYLFIVYNQLKKYNIRPKPFLGVQQTRKPRDISLFNTWLPNNMVPNICIVFPANFDLYGCKQMPHRDKLCQIWEIYVIVAQTFIRNHLNWKSWFNINPSIIFRTIHLI